MHTCQLHTGEGKTFLGICVSFNAFFFLALKMNKWHFRISKNSKFNNNRDRHKNRQEKVNKSSKGRVLSSAGWTDGRWRLCQRAEQCKDREQREGGMKSQQRVQLVLEYK